MSNKKDKSVMKITSEANITNQTPEDLEEVSLCVENSCRHGRLQANKDSMGISEHVESFDLLAKCPRSVALKIFGYFSMGELLQKLCLVCKDWRNIVFDPHIWSEIDLSGKVINDNVLKTIPTLCHFTTYILLSDNVKGDLSDNGMIALAKGCPNLKTFYAPRCDSYFTEEALIAFPSYCRELRELHFDGLKVSDKILQLIAESLKNLEILTLIQSTAFTEDGLENIFKRCNKLYECRLGLNQHITGKCFKSFGESSKSLCRLDLRMCNINPRNVANLAVLSNLSYLNLTNCKTLTIDDLSPVLKSCKNITRLGLSLNKNVDDDFINVLFTYLPGMIYLFIVSTAISDQALITMSENSQCLYHLDVGHTKVTDIGVRAMSKNCLSLRYFGLMTCKFLQESRVDELVEEFPHIRYSTFIQDTKRLFLDEDE